jgi:hypothetical protein
VIRFWRWLAHGEWEIGRGIDIDMDGDISGSGFMFRVERPLWLRRWAARRLSPKTEEEMFSMREDISDVLLASLMITPNLLGALSTSKGDYASHLDWNEEGERG